ncbi:hypothetical protein QQX09_13850 [Demequina sp. SYSU T00192]|uniref:Protein-tyrosine-phosphatase-like N-terminal domain-containing protein n=1 Tax=Demequina litoralis TaxID=3051660 RepID=A0ABT8GCS4_9MICO|nr:hypothetical protein [Demequina sp. SYSU T00192]MDN4476938.1 hypothetical protein [Demequina sp. SYSU T00192]
MTITPANHFDRESAHEHVDRALDDAVTHLAEHFIEFDRPLIQRMVRESYEKLAATAVVHQHLVTLAEHRAWLRLDDLRTSRM